MTKRALVARFALAWVVSVVTIAAQNNAADTATLIEALQLEAGSVVAEVGAGDGELTIAIAKHVGPTGRVFASELGTERVAKLQSAVKQAGAQNVQVIEGKDNEANLADGCCDAMFMRNVYHHFGAPPTMLASFLRALKPGGRVAVIDFVPGKNVPTAPPGKRGQESSHGVNAETVEAELKAAGFELVSSKPGGERWFVVVAAKPKA